MPVNLDAIGIQSVELTLAESVEVTRKVETKPLLDKDGRFADAKAFDPSTEFSLKGRGDLPAGIAAGTDGGLHHRRDQRRRDHHHLGQGIAEER